MLSAGANPGVGQLLAAQLAAFLALLLAVAAVHKWVRWDHTRGVVHEFAGVPRAAAAWGVAGAGIAELLAAALLIVPAQRFHGALLAALIFGAYLALMLRAILQGRHDVDCGCSFGSTHRPLGAFDLGRNALLAAGASFAAASAAHGAAPVNASQLLAACALLALYGALDQVMALKPMRSGAVL